MKRKRRGRGRPKGSKNQLVIEEKILVIDPEKAELIKQIWALEPQYKELDIDLTKHSIENLQKHIDRVKEKREEKC